MTALKRNVLLRLLVDQVTALSERLHQKLSVLIVYVWHMMRVMSKQKVCLMSLLAYVKGAMTEGNLRSSFFPQFMMYLDSGSHACECSDCHLFCLKQFIKPTLAFSPLISPDLTYYSDPDFTFTDEEWSNLWEFVINNQISTNALGDVTEYYRGPNTSMDACLRKLREREMATQQEMNLLDCI